MPVLPIAEAAAVAKLNAAATGEKMLRGAPLTHLQFNWNFSPLLFWQQLAH